MWAGTYKVSVISSIESDAIWSFMVIFVIKIGQDEQDNGY